MKRLRDGLAHSITALYWAKLVSYGVPVVLIPYLARVLGASGWGLVAFAQGFAGYGIILIEYGFEISATRTLAKEKPDSERAAAIVAGTAGAKVVLSIGFILLASVVGGAIPEFAEHRSLLLVTVMLAVARGNRWSWYFQARERMRLVAALETANRVSAAVFIFILVRQPSDAWRVVGIYAVAASMSATIGGILVYREVGFRLPEWSSALAALQDGFAMLCFRGSTSLYTSGNAFILGLLASPATVGIYAGAERIARAAVSLADPVSRAMLPHLSRMAQTAYEEAEVLAQRSLLWLGAGGAIGGLLLALGAGPIVALVLGRGFHGSAGVLRALSPLLPLVAISNVLGLQWLVPLGHDRSFVRVILVAGLANLLFAVLLAPVMGAYGMALAVVTAEVVATWGLYRVMREHGVNFIGALR